jgi:hypothetical protein
VILERILNRLGYYKRRDLPRTYLHAKGLRVKVMGNQVIHELVVDDGAKVEFDTHHTPVIKWDGALPENLENGGAA